MKKLQDYINEALVSEAGNPKKVLDANYKKMGYIDDILYAWDIANDLAWKKKSDSEILDWISERDDLDEDEGSYYLDLIHAMVQLGKDASKSYIENNWDKELKNLNTPW